MPAASSGLRSGLPARSGLVAVLAPLAYYPAYLLRAGGAGSWAGFWDGWLALGIWPAGPAWFLWVLLAFSGLAASLQVWAPGALARLSALGDWCRVGPVRACAALGKLARVRGLELLDVRSAVIPAAGLAELRAILGEARVLPRPPQRVSFRFGALDLSGTSLTAAEVVAVIATGAYASAVRLVLGRNRLGDAGVAQLAACGQLPALAALELDAVLQLSRSSSNLVHLPHDSCAQNAIANRACSPMSTVSSNTTIPPCPTMAPAAANAS